MGFSPLGGLRVFSAIKKITGGPSEALGPKLLKIRVFFKFIPVGDKSKRASASSQAPRG